MKPHKTIEVFVGNEDGGELGDMGQRAAERGFHVLKNSTQAINRIKETKPDKVIICGGSLFVCVPEIAKYCDGHGIESQINISDCRINPQDTGSGNVGNRRTELELGLGKKLFHFKNIKIKY